MHTGPNAEEVRDGSVDIVRLVSDRSPDDRRQTTEPYGTTEPYWTESVCEKMHRGTHFVIQF